MTAPAVIQGDMFDAYVAYLRHTATYVEQVYQFDKAEHLLAGTPPLSRGTPPYCRATLQAGASMFHDMIYTAWIDSAQPVVDPYAGK